MATKQGLPRFVVFKSKKNDKYLRYINKEGDNYKFLEFSGEEILNPFSKFEVERAKSNDDLVHIRCCYNNKYWVRHSESDQVVVAIADKPEEDQSKWSCTLFKPVFGDDDNAKTVRLLHDQLKLYVVFDDRSNSNHYGCLYAGSKYPDNNLTDFLVTDWETLVILPKHVAFKGCNDKYLHIRDSDSRFLTFAATDIGDSTVGNEIITNKDGSIHIKYDFYGKYWCSSPDWIWPTSADDTTIDTLFWPVKIDDNVIALRSLGNGLFCECHDDRDNKNCLGAYTPTITKEARLVVEELVLSRKIYNVRFRLADARIYDEVPILMDKNGASNSTEKENELEVTLSYTTTESKTWAGSLSLKLGIEVEIKAGIPTIEEQSIKVSTEFEAKYEWGETKQSSTTRSTTYKAVVPPNTSVTVSLLATKGKCDVPFSYTQRDTLTSGEQINYEKDDGIFNGINFYSLRFETTENKI